MSAEQKQHSSHDVAVVRGYFRTPGMFPDGREAFERLVEQLEAEKRDEWREGIVNVLDHEGNYLGCLGSETWAWTLSGGIESLKEQLDAVGDEAQAAHHRAEIAEIALEELREELGAQRKALRGLLFAAEKADVYPHKRAIVAQYETAKENAHRALSNPAKEPSDAGV